MIFPKLKKYKLTELICNYVEYICYGQVRFLQNPCKSI